MTIRWVLGPCFLATVAATACDHHDAPEADGAALHVITEPSVDLGGGLPVSGSEAAVAVQLPPSPCAARNPIRLVDGDVLRARSGPEPQISSFQLPIAAAVCIRVATLDTRHRENLKDVSVDGASILGKRALEIAGGSFQTELQLDAGAHQLSVVLAGRPGTGVAVEV